MTACHIINYAFLIKYRRRFTMNATIREKFIEKLVAEGLTDEVAENFIKNDKGFALAVVKFIKNEGFGGYHWNGGRFEYGIKIAVSD